MSITLRIAGYPEPFATETRTFKDGEVVIGRGPIADWVLQEKGAPNFLSRRHCKLTFNAGNWVVTDTSTNGTMLNGVETPNGQPSRPLRNGDKLNVGRFEIEILLDVGETGVFDGAPPSPQLSTEASAGGRIPVQAFLSSDQAAGQPPPSDLFAELQWAGLDQPAALPHHGDSEKIRIEAAQRALSLTLLSLADSDLNCIVPMIMDLVERAVRGKGCLNEEPPGNIKLRSMQKQLPDMAPALYQTRPRNAEGKRLGIIDFLREVWFDPWIKEGFLTRPALKALDPSAAKALENYLHNHPEGLPADLNLLKRSEVVSREVATLNDAQVRAAQRLARAKQRRKVKVSRPNT